MSKSHLLMLRDIIDDNGGRLERDDAIEIHAALWTCSLQTERLQAARKTVADLHAECDKLVAQVVSEEQRARDLERKLNRAVELLRMVVEQTHNPKRAREAVALALSSLE